MKTLILYKTKYGTAKLCADLIKEKLISEVDVVELTKRTKIDLDNYDNVIIGGSIYIGMISKHLRKFIIDNLEVLLTKKLALYVCAMREGMELDIEIKNNFPEELISKVNNVYCLGGAFDFEKMNILERFIVKKVANVFESKSFINEDEIDNLVKTII